jgi:hypothetical protein
VWDQELFNFLTSKHKDHSTKTKPKTYDDSKAKWDGNPIPKSDLVDKQKFFEWMCPSKSNGPYWPAEQAVLKGIEEVYARVGFADASNPTIAEVDKYHTAVVQHFRRMLGISETVVPFRLEKCLSAQALWSSEFKFTEKYGNHASMCKVQPHCGFDFFPSSSQRQQYFQDGSTCDQQTSMMEGIVPYNIELNWAWRLPNAICGIIYLEGVQGGHLQPYIHNFMGGFAFSKTGRLFFQNTAERKCTDDEIYCCNCQHATNGDPIR